MRRIIMGLAAGLALSACQEGAAVRGGGGGLPATAGRVSAPGIPVAVHSISGAPDTVATRFASLLGEAAAERQMQIVQGDAPARFRVRGYLTAQPTEDGQTALAFVWDVYDETRRRAQRVQGESLGRTGSGTDPWAAIDQGTVARAAADSMDAIATFLTTQPADTADGRPGAGGRDGGGRDGGVKGAAAKVTAAGAAAKPLAGPAPARRPDRVSQAAE